MTLDEEFLVFTSLLGEAIAMWAAVEKYLNDIVVSCFKNDDREAIGIGFFKLEGFRAKLDFADGVVACKIADEHLEGWAELVDRLSTLSRSRNKIAHFPVGMHKQASIGRRVISSSWITVKSNDSNFKTPPPNRIAASDLLKIVSEFAALTNALENFAARIHEQPEPHPKSAERASHQMTVQIRLRQIRATLRRPQQSSREKRLQESAANAAASLQNPIEGKLDEFGDDD